ncbi:MAG: hypothetical protein GTN78_26225 [Gemmatimonadales bacterium]|nr:hypothetical protein [Gemmatimonadales bacterium]
MTWDDFWHTLGGILVPLPALLGWPIFTAVAVGLLREIAQMQQKKKDLGHPWDWGLGRTIDMIGWLLGGIILQGAHRWVVSIGG